jgi:hypothetical protein
LICLAKIVVSEAMMLGYLTPPQLLPLFFYCRTFQPLSNDLVKATEAFIMEISTLSKFSLKRKSFQHRRNSEKIWAVKVILKIMFHDGRNSVRENKFSDIKPKEKLTQQTASNNLPFI